MFGLDDRIAALGTGDTFLLVIAVAALLGLRHATDPDHLTAVSMAIASTTFGLALSRGPLLRGFATAAPALGTLSLAFGAWYALGALGAVPYFF